MADFAQENASCWNKSDLNRLALAGTMLGAVGGTIMDGPLVGTVPGAIVGAVYGVGEWVMINGMRELIYNSCPADTKTLPQVDIEHPDQK